MLAEVSDENWARRVDTSVIALCQAVRKLLEVVSDAVDWESEAAEVIRREITNLHEAVDETGRAGADRKRAVTMRRVRKAA